MTAHDKLCAWADRVARLNSAVRNLATDAQAVEAPPLAGVSPDEAATVLVDLWHLLGLKDPGHVRDLPAETKIQVLDYLRPALDAVPHAYVRLGDALDQALGCLAASHEALIRTGEFVQVLLTVPEPQGLTARPTVIGPVSSLPPGHRYRSLLPLDELFVSEHGPALVLGLGRPGAARPYYWSDSAARLTRAWRAKQRQQDAERQALEERDRLDRQRRWEESPQGREAELRKRIAALEAQLATAGGGG